MATRAARSGRRGACGMTLLEALVVIAVLAILLGLAAPGLSGWRERQQLQAQAEDFWNSLMLARAQAMLHQQLVTICPALEGECSDLADWHVGWLVFVDTNRNGRREAHETLLQTRQAAPSLVRITGNSTVRRRLGYGAEGRSEGLSGAFLAGTVTVCSPGLEHGWRVVVNAVGRPRLEQGQGTQCP